MTVVTTIGYGNIAPTTAGGRLFFIFFALLGIPLAAFFLAGLGEKLQIPVQALKDRVCFPKHKKLEKWFKSATIILTGFLLLLLVPSAVFSAVEGWAYGDSIYYSIVTLTTVGFGDYVIGQEDKSYRIPYKLVFAVWIVFGLAWVAVLIGEGSSYYKDQSEKVEQRVNRSLSRIQDITSRNKDVENTVIGDDGSTAKS
ncbi:hypothetical protein ScPMuIL_001507 [Solemya velum]